MSQIPLFPNLVMRDTRANQPAANTVSPGTIYSVTDEDFLQEQSDGSAWAQYGPTPGGGGGIPEGTSFPGSPSTDDLFHRTDLNLIFFYDGTRWLTINQYTITFTPYGALGSTSMSATTNVRMQGWKPCAYATDFFVEQCMVNGAVSTTNNGTNYWRFDFVADSGGGSTVTVASPETGTEPWTASAYGVSTATPNVLLGTTVKAIYVNCVKVLSPGNLNLYTAQMVGRIVGT